jgi:hypothetical protein
MTGVVVPCAQGYGFVVEYYQPLNHSTVSLFVLGCQLKLCTRAVNSRRRDRIIDLSHHYSLYIMMLRVLEA